MLIDNLEKIRYRIRAAALRAGRKADGIALVAVIKSADAAQVRELLEKGLADQLGVNRVQDALARRADLGPLASRARWRLIGHLQTNKARKAAEAFDAVDSVDSERAAAALDAAAGGLGRPPLEVLAQVKLDPKEARSGVAPDDLPGLLGRIRGSRNLRLAGLMGLAPEAEDPEDARPAFRLLRELRDRHLPGGKLSMGMSRDFEVAVEEGADFVRVGTQIFKQQSPASMEATA